MICINFDFCFTAVKYSLAIIFYNHGALVSAAIYGQCICRCLQSCIGSSIIPTVNIDRTKDIRAFDTDTAAILRSNITGHSAAIGKIDVYLTAAFLRNARIDIRSNNRTITAFDIDTALISGQYLLAIDDNFARFNNILIDIDLHLTCAIRLLIFIITHYRTGYIQFICSVQIYFFVSAAITSYSSSICNSFQFNVFTVNIYGSCILIRRISTHINNRGISSIIFHGP